MKKIKLLPSMLLLVLCLAVLGVGIYAAQPASNTISGTVTVTAANAEVAIEVYKNGLTTQVGETFNTRTGSTINLGTQAFVRKASAYAGETGTLEEKQSLARANTIDEVEDIELFFKIYNHSSKKLAVYFNTGSAMTTDIGTMITENSVAVATAEGNIIDHKDMGTDALVTAYLSEYVELPATSAVNLENEDYSVTYALMKLHLNRLIESPDVNIDLSTANLFLNVEPYYEDISVSKQYVVVLDLGTGNTASRMYFTTENTHYTASVRQDYDNRPMDGAVIIPTAVLKNGTFYKVTTIPDANGGPPRGAFTYTPSDYSHACSFTYLKICEGLESIVGYGFYYCSSLTTVVLPHSLKNIGQSSFASCSGLTSILIPNSVSSIGTSGYSSPFNYCSGLESVVVEQGNRVYKGNAGNNAIIEIATDTLVLGISSDALYSGLKHIGKDAFAGRTTITSVTIPDSVLDIGNYAFRRCTGLNSLTFGSGLVSLGEYAFDGCTNLTSITIPSNVTSIGSNAFRDCSLLATVTIESQTIVNGLTGRSVYGNLIYNATTIRIPTSLTVDTSVSTYLAGKSHSTVGDYEVYTISL